MYTNIFDTHSHYADARFDADRETLLAGLPEAGVELVMLAGCSVADSAACAALAERFAHVYCAVGIHPENVATLQENWLEELAALAEHPKVKAIGEIGLDYHTPGYDAARQKDVLIRQTRLAKKLGLPVMLHIREAMGDAMEILRQERPAGVIHCFGGSKETAREAVGLGLYLGFGGVLTFPNARKAVEAVACVPADRMVLETDCPYLAPVPYRGQRCDSRMIAAVAERAAEIRGTDAQTLIDTCCANGKRLFGIA